MIYAKKAMGISDTLIFFMLAAIVLAAMFIMFAMVVVKYKAVLVETGDLESDILVERLTYSPHCLAYYDSEIKRTYPNIVEWDKLTQDNLNGCYDGGYDITVVINSPDAGVEHTLMTSEQPAGLTNKYVKSIILFKDGVFFNAKMEVYVSE